MKASFKFNTAKVLVLVTLWLTPRAQAADYDIFMDENGFDPAYLEVQVGDRVFWWNVDSFGDVHSTHSYTYPWNSGPVAFNHGVYLTVTKIGTFPYQDDYSGDFATLVVKAVTSQPPPAPVLLDPARQPDGTFQFTVSNLVAGTTNLIQASTNFVDWTSIYTNVAPGASYLYVDIDAVAFSRRTYRAVVLP